MAKMKISQITEKKIKSFYLGRVFYENILQEATRTIQLSGSHQSAKKQTTHLSTKDLVFLFCFQTFHNDISRGLSIIRVYMFMHPFIMKNEFPESNGGNQGAQVCEEKLMWA